MSSNLNTEAHDNHSFVNAILNGGSSAVDHPPAANAAGLDDDAVELLVDLRNACAAARSVLCKAIMTDEFDQAAATAAVQSINNAIIRSSFLD